jgi:predicted porin
MKKIAKLSLVAAMAVTAANATALEEAIKNVDVSGKVYVETIANTDQTANGSTDTLTDIDVDVTVKSKVNDNVTAVVRVQADGGQGENVTVNNANVNDQRVVNQNVDIDNVYFAYTNGALTANIGKQDMNTPNTDGEIGDGALALYNAGSVTLAGAYFYDHNLNAFVGEDISVAAVLGSAGPVNFEAWYVGLTGDHFTAVASTKLAGVTLAARYAVSELDGATAAANNDDLSTIKLTANASFGAIGVNATYLKTDDDGGATVTDSSSANTYELSQLGLQNGTLVSDADADVYALGVNYTADKMVYAVDYANFDSSANNEEAEELRLRATYNMSSNFRIMATYSMFEVETNNATTTDNNSARLEARYSF